MTPGQVSASAPQSGNLVSVSRSERSQSALAVAVRFASGLRPTGRLRPAMPKLGPMKLSPGKSCEAAYSVWRAPKSASVASFSANAAGLEEAYLRSGIRQVD